MYKVTVGGKTLVGCNEDTWRTTSRIWFENAKEPHEFGAIFTGSRQVSLKQFAPQSGMNEAGLTFSRLAAYYPQQDTKGKQKKRIINEVEYLVAILHQCATIEEVKEFVEQYDHSFFIEDVFIYLDSTGKYLVVEPYNLIEGNNPYYVLSNFCPSITDNEQARKLERFRNGEDFLQDHQPDSSLSFCRALSDTMHVCRNRNGDGTLLTSIWDTKSRSVNLYFYHNFDTTVQFNLAEELQKGDHILNTADLFPRNLEFDRLIEYKTPFNTPLLRVLLALVGGALPLVALIFLLVSVLDRNLANLNRVLVIAAIVDVFLALYFFVLATNINVFYFDAPYRHFSSNLISAASFIPFLLLLSAVPVLLLSAGFIRKAKRRTWIKSLLVANNFVYLTAIFGFAYWGLYTIF
ncbi:MAG: hypothetical protein KDC80_17700 [Saprospiraceae bacterium]|nr:hypothetical protein [Saprospiraceae bacterium]